MHERVLTMLRKEFIQMLRDPRMRTVVFVMPVVQVLVFGYAVTTDVKHVRLAVYDVDSSAESRELVSQFDVTEYFDVTARVTAEEQVQRLLDHGDAQAVLRINRGFAAASRSSSAFNSAMPAPLTADTG